VNTHKFERRLFDAVSFHRRAHPVQSGSTGLCRERREGLFSLLSALFACIQRAVQDSALRGKIWVITNGVGIDLIETAHNDYSRTRSIVQGNYAASSTQVLTRLLLKEGKDVCKPRRAPRGRKAAGHL
jgi:hypothetical protein